MLPEEELTLLHGRGGQGIMPILKAQLTWYLLQGPLLAGLFAQRQMLPSPCVLGFVFLRTWLGLLIEVSTSPDGLGLSKAIALFASVPLLQP